MEDLNLHANSPMATRGHCRPSLGRSFSGPAQCFLCFCFSAKVQLFLPASPLTSILTPSVTAPCWTAKQLC